METLEREMRLGLPASYSGLTEVRREKKLGKATGEELALVVGLKMQARLKGCLPGTLVFS